MLFNTGLKKSRTFALPIISIGNISVGGTGKTPHVEYLVRLLQSKTNVATLSRGYKRKTKGYVLAHDNSDVDEIGDEPLQLKQKFSHIHVAVCEKRVFGIENLREEKPKPGIIILDDAFQHRYVQPTVNILLTDYRKPYWKDFVLPAGSLRENRRGARRADIVIITKCPETLGLKEKEIIARKATVKNNQQLFFTHIDYGDLRNFHTHTAVSVASIKQEKILMVTGIANSLPFQEYIQSHAAESGILRFPDHHNFSVDNIQKIKKEFVAGAYTKIITTEKDAVRLKKTDFQEIPLFYLPISVQFLFADKERFDGLIESMCYTYMK